MLLIRFDASQVSEWRDHGTVMLNHISGCLIAARPNQRVAGSQLEPATPFEGAPPVMPNIGLRLGDVNMGRLPLTATTALDSLQGQHALRSYVSDSVHLSGKIRTRP